MAKNEQTVKQRKVKEPEYEHVTTQYADKKTIQTTRDVQLDEAPQADTPTPQVTQITHHKAIDQSQTVAQLS